MKDLLVYLAGPITGLQWGEATDWREQVKDSLQRPTYKNYDLKGYSTLDNSFIETVPSKFNHIHTLSPLRGKQYLESRSSTDGAIACTYEEYPLSSARGINTRDHWDVMRSDVIFVNLLGAKTVSIGTVMEIAWAYAYKKPVILVIEKEGNIHEHAMIRESIGFRVETVEKGIEVLKAICGTDKVLE